MKRRTAAGAEGRSANEILSKPKPQNKANMIGTAIEMTGIIKLNFKNYGTLPLCRRCPEEGRQYEAPGLMRFECRKGIWPKRGEE